MAKVKSVVLSETERIALEKGAGDGKTFAYRAGDYLDENTLHLAVWQALAAVGKSLKIKWICFGFTLPPWLGVLGTSGTWLLKSA